MCKTWKEHESEYSKKKSKMTMMEIKIKNLQIKLEGYENKLHDMRNEFTTWNLEKQFDLEEKLGKKQ